MSNDMILSNTNAFQLPAHLQGANVNVSEGFLATIGTGGNRIGLKGSRFRQIVNGKEEGVWDENYLDVIILGAVPAISRIFYEGAYEQDTKTAPNCYSADGIAPADDVKNKQAEKCATCPQNQKGSKIANGQKVKACGFFQRVVLMLAGDTEGMTYTLDIKSMGIFGESHPNINKYNIRDYTKLLANRGADMGMVVTRLSFDTDSSVPKLLFSAARFVEPEELAVVQMKVASEEVKRLLQINMSTVDLSGEVDGDEQQAPPASQPQAAQTVKPAAQPVKAVEAAPASSKLVMTAKAEGLTYEEFIGAGWDDEGLIAEGYATRPAPPKPAAPKPTPQPAKAAAPKPTPAQAPAKPTPQQPVKAAPQAAKPVPGRPAVTKAHPVPSTPPQQAAAPQVEETNSDAEVEAILASLV